MDCVVHEILQARILKWVAFPFSRGSFNPGSKPRSPALQADSLPAVSPKKPKNTEVGSLFLLQGFFLTQESNRGLLHCRRILYQLSYQGNPLYLGLKPNLGLCCSISSISSRLSVKPLSELYRVGTAETYC